METQNDVEDSTALSIKKAMNLAEDLKEELRRRDAQIKALNIQLDKERSKSKEMDLVKYLKEVLQRKDERIKELNSQLDQEYSKYNVLLTRMEREQLKKSIKIQNQREEIEWANKTNDELIKLVKEFRDKNKSLHEKIDDLISKYGKNLPVAEATNKELNPYNCPSSSNTEKLEIRFESFQSLRNDLILKANNLEPKERKVPDTIPLLIELDDSPDETVVIPEKPKTFDVRYRKPYIMKLSASDLTKDNLSPKTPNVNIIGPQAVRNFNKKKSEISTNSSETTPLITSGVNDLKQSSPKVLFIDKRRSVLKPQNGNSPYYTCVATSSSIPSTSISPKQPASITSSLLASFSNNLLRKDNLESDLNHKKGKSPSEHTASTSKPILSIPSKQTASKTSLLLGSTTNTYEEWVPKLLSIDLDPENGNSMSRKLPTYTDKLSGRLQDTFIMSNRKGTRLRPFKCDVCECVFAQKIHLTAHQQKHSIKKSFKRDISSDLKMRRERLDFHNQNRTATSINDSVKNNLIPRTQNLDLNSLIVPIYKVKSENLPNSLETALTSSSDEITTEYILPDQDVSVFSEFKYFKTISSEPNDHTPVLEPDEDDDIDVGSEDSPASESHVRNSTLANEIKETTIQDMPLITIKGSGIQEPKPKIRHPRKHTVKKPFKCNICNRIFSLKMLLNIHNRQHTGDKPFKCEICNYSAKRKSHLVRHRIKHTDERPFQCDLCSCAFRQKINLVVHRRVHTGEKPYKCTQC